MNIEESGLKIIKLIRAAEMKTEGYQDGHLGFFSINVQSLDKEEQGLLTELLIGKLSNDIFKCYIADNNEDPIIFINERDAYGTLVKEGPSLEKKFQFALFCEKGIMVNLPKNQVISFIPKR